MLRDFIEHHGERRTIGERKTQAVAAADLVAARAQEGGILKQTLQSYALTSKRILEAPIGRLRLGEIEPADPREHSEHMRKKGRPPSALAREMGHVWMLLRWLQLQEVIRENPAAIVETPKAPRGSRPAVTPVLFERLRADAFGVVDAAAMKTERREAQLVMDLFDVLWWSGLQGVAAM